LKGAVGGVYAKSQCRIDFIRLARQSEIEAEVEDQVKEQLSEYQSQITELEKQLQQKNLALELKGAVITASSEFGVSSGKRYIRVKWTVSDQVDGMKYQVWKSSKKNSRYSKMISTSKKSYKNTAGLVKGKTYYYKVRGYKSIGGKYYYTNWSNKVYRTVKK
jgi:lactocepin